jgi:hypothetical protein
VLIGSSNAFLSGSESNTGRKHGHMTFWAICSAESICKQYDEILKRQGLILRSRRIVGQICAKSFALSAAEIDLT